MPEKVRKGYAAFSNFRGSNLDRKHMEDGALAVLSLNVGNYFETEN